MYLYFAYVSHRRLRSTELDYGLLEPLCLLSLFKCLPTLEGVPKETSNIFNNRDEIRATGLSQQDTRIKSQGANHAESLTGSQPFWFAAAIWGKLQGIGNLTKSSPKARIQTDALFCFGRL